MIKITDEKVLSDKRYKLSLITYKFNGADGKELEDEREIYHHSDAATVLLYDGTRKKILMTEQIRLPVFVNEGGTGKLVEPCAGLLEEGESPEVTMIREIEEETGYVVKKIEKVYEAYNSAGYSTERIHFYVGEYSPGDKKSEGGGLKEEGEDIRVFEWSYEEAFSALQNGKLRDVKGIILLQYLRIKFDNP